jgi:hypothetical protein
MKRFSHLFRTTIQAGHAPSKPYSSAEAQNVAGVKGRAKTAGLLLSGRLHRSRQVPHRWLTGPYGVLAGGRSEHGVSKIGRASRGGSAVLRMKHPGGPS